MSIHPEDRKLTKLEHSVEEVLTENQLQAVLHFSKIYKNWEVIVGKPLTTKTSPAKLDKKTLIVNVVDAAYSHHLKYYEKSILELIASPEICGEGIVKKVVFKVGKALRWNSLNQDVQESDENTKRKRDQKPDERAESTAVKIADKGLRSAFSRYMSKNLPVKEEDEKK